MLINAILFLRKIAPAIRGINVKLGRRVYLGKRLFFHTEKGGEINIGDNCNLGNDCVISAKQKITIGNSCLFAARVSIHDHFHKTGNGINPTKSGLTEARPVEIGDCCYLGVGAVIQPGVTLGDYCTVGSNAVVTKSFPPCSVIAGVPAKIIKK